MLPYRDSRVTKTILLLLFLLIAIYGYFESRGILFGPRIQVATEQELVHDQFITISGTADRIATLTMNGAPVTVTETGAFSVPYLLAPGSNRIALDAADKYGHSTEKVLEIVYEPIPEVAVATSSTTTQ